MRTILDIDDEVLTAAQEIRYWFSDTEIVG